MTLNKSFALLALATLGLLVVACGSATTTDVKLTVTTATTEPAAPTLPISADTVTETVSASTSMLVPTRLPQPTATPTVAAPAAEEIDCMGACHEIDINELFAANAKHQPANHKGRTTCLECHATFTEPALPATHLGRLDAACNGCHKVQ